MTVYEKLSTTDQSATYSTTDQSIPFSSLSPDSSSHLAPPPQLPWSYGKENHPGNILGRGNFCNIPLCNISPVIVITMVTGFLPSLLRLMEGLARNLVNEDKPFTHHPPTSLILPATPTHPPSPSRPHPLTPGHPQSSRPYCVRCQPLLRVSPPDQWVIVPQRHCGAA